MEDLKVGSVVRAVRRRRGLRQLDVANRAGVGQWAVSAVERGDLERLPFRTIRRVGAVLEIALMLAPRWRGGELPRLVDARHASMVESVIASLPVDCWEVVPEYTFSHYRDSGAVDVLAWHRESRALLLVEVKTELDDLQKMPSVLDRKARLVPDLVATERGWRAEVVALVLAAPDVTSFREAVARHRATFAASFPRRTARYGAGSRLRDRPRSQRTRPDRKHQERRRLAVRRRSITGRHLSEASGFSG